MWNIMFYPNLRRNTSYFILKTESDLHISIKRQNNIKPIILTYTPSLETMQLLFETFSHITNNLLLI